MENNEMQIILSKGVKELTKVVTFKVEVYWVDKKPMKDFLSIKYIHV